MIMSGLILIHQEGLADGSRPAPECQGIDMLLKISRKRQCDECYLG